MTELDEELPGLAAELIDEYGKNLPFVSNSPGVYDKETQTTVPNADNRTVKGVVEELRGDSFNGNLIVSGDKKITVAATSFAEKPLPGSTFNVDGEIFAIVDNGVKTTYSGELPCIYEIQGRK